MIAPMILFGFVAGALVWDLTTKWKKPTPPPVSYCCSRCGKALGREEWDHFYCEVKAIDMKHAEHASRESLTRMF